MKRADRYNPNTFNPMNAAAAYLLFYALMTVLGIVLSVAVIAVEAFGGVMDEGVLLFLNTLLLFFGLGGLSLLIAKKKGVNLINGGGFLFDAKPGLDGVMVVVGVCGMMVLLMPLAESVGKWVDILYEAAGVPVLSEINTKYEGLLVFTVLVLTPLVPAIVEELMFRGIILRGLMQYGKTTAIVLSSMMFALAHRNAQQFIYQFLLALAIGLLVVETKNMFLGMLAHFINNLFASVSVISLYGYAGEGVSAGVREAALQIVFVLIATVCFVAAFLYFLRRFTKEKKERNVAVNAALGGANELIVKPWQECGALSEKGGEPVYYLNETDGLCLMNTRSKGVLPLILIGLGLVLCLAEIALYFALPSLMNLIEGLA